MGTIVLNIKELDKAKTLMSFLKSIDYVSSVEYYDNYLQFKQLLESVNETAANTKLSELTLSQVNEEINAYRNGK